MIMNAISSTAEQQINHNLASNQFSCNEETSQQNHQKQQEQFIRVYYVDYECEYSHRMFLGTTNQSDDYSECLRDDSSHKHPFLVPTLLKLKNDNSSCIAQPFQQMKPTKRSFNVFKAVISSKDLIGFRIVFNTKEGMKEVEENDCNQEHSMNESAQNAYSIPHESDTQTHGILSKRRFIVYDSKLIEVKAREKGAKSVIISTDLGGTLCGIPEATRAFMELWLQYFYFDEGRRKVHRSKLIYNSGRGIVSFTELSRLQAMLLPDSFIGRCGTCVYLKGDSNNNDNKNNINSIRSSRLSLDTRWQDHLAKEWKPDAIRKRMQELTWLELRLGRDQEQFSVRFICDVGEFYAHIAEFNQARIELNQAGIHYTEVVREKKGFMQIEIVPSATDKGIALEYVLRKLIGEEIMFNSVESVEKEEKTMIECDHVEKWLGSEELKVKVESIRSGNFEYPAVLISHAWSEAGKKQFVVSAFGDTMNDDGMLRICDRAVVVGNCEKQFAEWVSKEEQRRHPNLSITQEYNGYALVQFLREYI